MNHENQPGAEEQRMFVTSLTVFNGSDYLVDVSLTDPLTTVDEFGTLQSASGLGSSPDRQTALFNAVNDARAGLTNVTPEDVTVVSHEVFPKIDGGYRADVVFSRGGNLFQAQGTNISPDAALVQAYVNGLCLN